jgi:hypothetical protein
MADEMVPSGAATNTPAPPTTPVNPGAVTPVPGGGRATQARAAGPGTAISHVAHSWIDEMVLEMTQLGKELEALFELMEVLYKTANALSLTIDNVDELSKIYEAPTLTVQAVDADSVVASIIVDLATTAGSQVGTARGFNAAGLEGLRAMLAIQESQRAIGAGPKLLATARS